MFKSGINKSSQLRDDTILIWCAAWSQINDSQHSQDINLPNTFTRTQRSSQRKNKSFGRIIIKHLSTTKTKHPSSLSRRHYTVIVCVTETVPVSMKQLMVGGVRLGVETRLYIFAPWLHAAARTLLAVHLTLGFPALETLCQFVLTTMSAWGKKKSPPKKTWHSKSFQVRFIPTSSFQNTTRSHNWLFPPLSPCHFTLTTKKFPESIWDFNGSHFWQAA